VLPTWSRSGRELFFLKRNDLVSVKIDSEGRVLERERVVIAPPKLGELEFQSGPFGFYDVLPDGDHFVMLLTPRLVAPTHYDLVINWFEEIKRVTAGGR
jgi:hypothetical protein